MVPSFQVQPHGGRSPVWTFEPLGGGGYNHPCPRWFVLFGPHVVGVSWSTCQDPKAQSWPGIPLTLLLTLLPMGHEWKGLTQRPQACVCSGFQNSELQRVVVALGSLRSRVAKPSPGHRTGSRWAKSRVAPLALAKVSITNWRHGLSSGEGGMVKIARWSSS